MPTCKRGAQDSFRGKIDPWLKKRLHSIASKRQYLEKELQSLNSVELKIKEELAASRKQMTLLQRPQRDPSSLPRTPLKPKGKIIF
jgi:hypothetical protein